MGIARFLPRLVAAALVLLLGVRVPHADRLVTVDGRLIDVKKVRKQPSGDYLLEFESGTLDCPAALIASVEVEGDMSDYVPADENERKKLAEGYVKYRGKWMAKAAYVTELEKEAARSKARTAELLAHSKFHNGWKQETKHFLIQSNTSPEILAHYAELLEAYYDLMDQRVGIDPTPTLKKTRMKVFIYKNRDEFQELTKVAPGVAGFFSPYEGELHFYHDYDDPEVSEWIALHECTHLLTFLIEPQARPVLWANEGVADYFGKARITRDKRGKFTIEPGQVQLERVLTVQQALEDGSYVPLERLFFLSKDEFDAFEYSHAWSFVYFLNNSKPEYEKAFKRFFKDVYTLAKGVEFVLDEHDYGKYGADKLVPPKEVRRVLLEKLGLKDTLALEEEWKAFIAALPIDGPKARLERALGILNRSDEREDLQRALDDVEAAIEAGSEAAQAFWARAELRLELKGDEKGAQADFERAIELAPLDASYHFHLAQLHETRSVRLPSHTGATDGRASPKEEALIAAERHYGLACELAPDNEFLREVRDEFLEGLQDGTAGR